MGDQYIDERMEILARAVVAARRLAARQDGESRNRRLPIAALVRRGIAADGVEIVVDEILDALEGASVSIHEARVVAEAESIARALRGIARRCANAGVAAVLTEIRALVIVALSVDDPEVLDEIAETIERFLDDDRVCLTDGERSGYALGFDESEVRGIVEMVRLLARRAEARDAI